MGVADYLQTIDRRNFAGSKCPRVNGASRNQALIKITRTGRVIAKADVVCWGANGARKWHRLKNESSSRIAILVELKRATQHAA
jgi:hypothetical protein